MSTILKLKLNDNNLDITLDYAIIAGWTGRDLASVNDHIKELSKLGVTPPKKVPEFYKVSSNRILTETKIEVIGKETSGEAEAVIFHHKGKKFVSVGSDHTDRALESHSVLASKQICDKPVSNIVWDFKDVSDHWDQLILKSYAYTGNSKELYQDGSLKTIQPPQKLIEQYWGKTIPKDLNGIMFCGTCSVIGKIRPADKFEIQLIDPVRKRSITHIYNIISLPG